MARKKYEYDTVFLPDFRFDRALDERGENGWMLVARVRNANEESGTYCTFAREKEPEE